MVRDMRFLGERQESFLHGFDDKMPIAVDSCVHDLIEQQTELNPAAIAVDAWDGCLSYTELENKSSALAQRLEAMGCGVGTWIPLFFERSVWVVVGMLAAMKCGAGFVLLEPSLPLERLQGICDDTNATLILTSKLLEQKAKGFRNQFLAIDAEQKYAQEMVSHPKTTHATPTDPVYAIFTSGSTGNPKGAVIEHGCFASSAMAHAPVAGYTSETRALNFCSYAFDACILEILTTLIVGGCVCIPSECDRWNDLPGAVRKLRANHLFVTPSMLPGLDRSQFPGLKTILLGGEKPSIHAFQQWLSTARVISAYGPSECSVSASFTDQLDLFSDPRDVGTPTGSRPWIIDSRNPEILVPIGATGELLLEGPIVGRGYLNNPQKTADAFISPPSWRERFPCYPKRKLYRTGDLAQYTRSGKIRIMGRKDTQVKLRGQRIELGEIECALYDILPSYAHIFVDLISQDENAESTMLVAILNQDNAEHEEADTASSKNALLGNAAAMSTLEAAPQGFVGEINKRLSTRLPQFMIPRLIFNVAKPPRTVGGKVDRRQLKHEAATLAREQLRGGATRAAESLFDTVPKSNGNVMVDLLCRVLGCSEDQLQAHHNFFQIGGDSLRAMKLANLARTHDITLSVQDIFRAPLVSEIIQVGEITNNADTKHTFKRGTTLDNSSTQELNSSEGVTVAPFSLLGRQRARKIIEEAVKRLHIEQFEIEDIYPCTAIQQGLMFLTMRNTNAYIARSTYALPPHCGLAQLKNAWKEVFEANPILRTRMIQTDAGVVQVVLRDHLQLVHGDNLMLHLASDRARPMGLNEPLLRVALITEAGETCSGQREEESYMIITIHHALYDGWSEGLILEQLEEAYGGAVLAHRPFAPFVKYVEESKEHAQKFWEGETAKTDCPKAVFPLPPAPGYQPNPGYMLNCSLDLTKGHTSSKFTLSSQLRLAWATVMQHFTSAAAVVFGVTVHGRGAPVPGIEALTGPTLATIPCSVYFQPSATIADMLDSVQDASMRSLPYEQVGLQSIQELNDAAAEACKFQSLLVVQPKSTSSKSVLLKPLADIEPENAAASFDTYPLTLQCSVLENKVELQATYDAHIISKPLLQKVLNHFKHVFAELSYDTARRFDQINPINGMDRLQLNQWYEQLRGDQLPQPPLVHDLIARQCEAQPQETAVNAWDGDFSYHEIETYASNLAAHLVQEGVKVNSIVPICFEKSKWLSVIIFAVIKCGAAFVLLDPSSQPLQRMQLITSEVDAQFIITSPALLATTGQISCVRSILVSEDAQWFPRSSAISPFYVEKFSDRTALYVIFTSGSTGKPKGVVIEHHGYSAGALSRSKITGLNSGSRVLQFASCTFDTFITDILDTLIAGACVCIPSESARNAGLGQVARDMGVTYADVVPSVARLISPQEIPTLETLVLSGESVTRNDVVTWYDKVRLCNLYGPAECSAVATGNVVTGFDPSPSNIGRGCGGTCWVVNPSDCDMLLPIGAIGELVIEGSIVGRGYLGQVSEEAASNFINIAPVWRRDFALGEGEFRMYKTGDLVQYQEDGKLLFIGRKDNQVKLHGQRLELGDVEHHLRNAFPTSLDAVATISCAPKERLVAFVVMGDTLASDTMEGGSDTRKLQTGSDGITIASSAFQKLIKKAEETLRDVLPTYMVPSAFLPVRELPRTPSGKVDRKTLPQLALEIIQRDGLKWYTAARQKRDPSTEAGKILQSVWARVLDIDSSLIGAEDGFLALGGDSIAAMRVAAMAASEDLHISVPDLFQNVSLERLTTSSSPASAATESIIWEKETAISLEMEMQPIQSAQNNLSSASNYLTEILLTGSTGRLGREIVKKLIGNPAVGKIHCVAIRNVDKLPEHEKIVVYIGDLSKPRLGMSEAEEANVLQSCQAIIHCGALVSFVQTYETMRFTNVESTKYLASLALKKHMPFHFISTAGVGERGDQAAIEEVSAARDKPPTDQSDGYTTTKWASEIFLEKVNSRFGLDITIHRPSNIICAGDPEADIVNNLLEYSRRMNAIPELNGWEGYFDFISGPSAAANIVETVLAALKRIVENGQRDPRAVQYIHESGETVVSVEDLGLYLGAQDDRPLQKIDMRSWVNNAMKEGMENIVGDFLCNMAASGEQVILPRIKSSRQPLG
ncbi:hypothetical protein NLG97_g1794 [Lecanicillium saksenae]|uniref:Uncharacterized protein n=1 Tax=Lecanicillium saksenae TaxID=468837 RepID=A0ACC1R3D0_9HYPO|nr:hypothetical protein NLG97_g1794 [Lecanicillium saksenae]